jgi:hypothetical protein
MANRKVRATPNKETGEMSEVREQVTNGEDEDVDTSVEEDGFTVFTLSAVHPDYDIVYRIQSDLAKQLVGVFQLANSQRGYKHLIGNEGASQGTAAKKKGEDAEAIMRDWRSKKRQAVIDGTLQVRSVGPRIDPIDREWFRLIDEKALRPKFEGAGIKCQPFPAGKTVVQGRTVQEWRDAYKASPKWAYLGSEAQSNVQAAAALAAAAKASGAAEGLKAALEADL